MKKIFAILLAVTALAFAENHSHDGFFINAQAGLGYYGISSDGFYDDISEKNAALTKVVEENLSI